MKTYTKDEVDAILVLHGQWFRREPDGQCANLSGADLSGANLYGANLSHANLSRANLSGADLFGANLSHANLSRANLSRADLSRANLYGANLSHANLSRANLSGADLSHANLSRANLSRANLSGADLFGANLSHANLSRANLSGADLSRANLYGADLSGADLSDLQKARLSIVPELGEFTAFKKTIEGIVTLRITEHAKRSNSTGRKCRASEALVIALPDGCTEAHALYDSTFIYRVGETVKPKDAFCDDRWQECASGIHFYITRAEAEAHQ